MPIVRVRIDGVLHEHPVGSIDPALVTASAAPATPWSSLGINAATDVVIPAGQVVAMDVPGVCHSLKVQGELRNASGVFFDLEARANANNGNNLHVDGGLLNPGLDGLIRFTDINEALFVGGGMSVLSTDPGLWVTGHGRALLNGRAKTPWGRVSGALSAGQTVINLGFDPIEWQIGDSLSITPTLPPSFANHYDAYDYPSVVAIAGRNITLSAPLQFDHPSVPVKSGLIFNAEVLNLTRSLKVQGEPGQRAHIMFLGGAAPQTLGYFEGRYLGPQRPINADGNIESVFGRYGMHYHMGGDGYRGSLATGVVLRDLGGPGFVPHGSNGITADRVIVHNGYRYGFWWDPIATDPGTKVWANASSDIIWPNCVASRFTTVATFRGFRIAAFHLSGGVGNRVEGGVAVGVQGAADASGMIWPEGESIEADRYANPFNAPVGVWPVIPTFVSHNNKVDGYFTWQNTENIGHDFDGLIAYYNGGVGIDHGAYVNPYRYRNYILYGNKNGAVTQKAMGNNDTDQKQIWEGGILDALGGTHCVKFAEHVINTGAPLRLNETYRNYTFAAFWVLDREDPDRLVEENFGKHIVQNPTFEGLPGSTPFWFDDNCHARTYIQVIDPNGLGNFTLRRKDWPTGVFVPAYNAKQI